MAIVHVKKRENPFVQIDKTPINDDRLSWKAKGILIYLLSKPNDWKVHVKDLIKRATDGKASVYSGLEELAQFGYIVRQQERKEDGTFGEMEYVVFETPQTGDQPHTENQHTDETREKSALSPYTENQHTDETVDITGLSPHTDFPDTDKPDTDNRTYNNNELNKNDKNNISDGRLGDESQDQREWDLIKNTCTKNELDKNMSREFYKVWKYYYPDAPVAVVCATINELMQDQYIGFTGKKLTYANIPGLFHHRMKQWRSMCAMYFDEDEN